MIRRLGEWKGFNQKKRLSAEVKVFGRGGLSFRKKDTAKSSDLAIDILVLQCLEWGPNIVFIQIGGNDINGWWAKGEINNKVDEINKKFFALIEIFLDRGIHVLLGEVLPRKLHGINCI